MLYEEFLKLRVGDLIKIESGLLNHQIFPIKKWYFHPESIKVDPNFNSIIIYDTVSPYNYQAPHQRQGILFKLNEQQRKEVIKYRIDRNLNYSKVHDIIEQQGMLCMHFSGFKKEEQKNNLNRELMLNKLNSHRKKYAQNALNAFNWTDEDLSLECERLGIKL